MNAGRFVGRVGGLAVALGVGAAVSIGTPAAWADDTATASAAGPSESAESADAAATAEPTATPTSTDGGTDGASPSPSDSADGVESEVSASSGSTVRAVAAGTVLSTGGADSSPETKDGDESTTDETAQSNGVKGDAGDSSRLRQAEETADTAPVSTVAAATVTVSSPSSADAPAPVREGVDVAVLTQITPVDVGEATVSGTESAVVSTALATTEVFPAAPESPVTPVDSPLELALLAVGARSRSFALDTEQSVATATMMVAVTTSAPPRLISQTPIPVGTNPTAVVVSADGRMFVANTGSKTISVINTATGQRIDASSSFFSKDITVGASPSALALSADGKRLYVANTGSNTVSVIDTATYKRLDVDSSFLKKDITVGAAPTALAVVPGGRLYVANSGANTVSVIDTATNKVIDLNPNVSGVQSITVGASPMALTLGANGRMYVANRGANTVSVIDTATNTVTATIAVGSQPTSMALGPQGRLYVVNTGANSVSVIDTTTNNAVGQPISVGQAPSSIGFSPDGTLAYVANVNDTISMVDTATNTVVRTVAIDTDTAGGHVIAVAPTGTVYVTDAVDKTVRVLTVSYGNTAPIAGTPTVVTNTATGVVTGSLKFTDPEGDALSYSLTQPTTGTLTITSNGDYTFTPTPAARGAAATGGPTSTTITITASDGQASTPVNLTVPITAPLAATSLSVLGNVSLTGFYANWPPVLSADGTRAVVTAYSPSASGTTTRVAVVNTATGKQVGTTLTLAGSPGVPMMSTDGTRALITTTTLNTTTGLETTRVTVINTVTGAQMGTTVGVIGSPAGATQLGPDAKRVLIVTDIHDVYDWDGAVTYSTGVAVIDTTTGAQIGTTRVMAGTPSSTLVTDGGTRALIAIPAVEAGTDVTLVTVIDTTTATQTGSTLTLTGNRSTAVMSADDKHAVVTTISGDADTGFTTRVSVIDMIAGAQVGTTAVLDDQSPSAAEPLTADASRAVVITRIMDPTTNTESTELKLIDTATGAQVGSPVTLDGAGSWMASADGTRIVFTATAGSGDTGFTARVAVIDAATGNPVGTTLELGGAPSTVLSADGTRLLVTTADRDNVANVDIGRVAVIDVKTGTPTFTPRTYVGQSTFGSLLVNADGSRALIVMNVYDGRTSINTTRLSIIDTSTGNQIGTTTSLTGFMNGGPRLTPDDRRAVVVTVSSNFVTTGNPTTQVAVIDTTTGTQAGATLTINANSGYSLLSPDGSRALIVVDNQMVVVNTATGTRTNFLNTGGSVYPQWTADGTRVVAITGSNPTRLTVVKIA